MKPIYAISAVVMVLILLVVGVSLGLRIITPPPSPTRSSTKGSIEATSFEQVRDVVHKAADYDDCRVIVQQLNLYVDGSAEEKPRGLSKEELDLLKNKDLFGLDDGELGEVNRATFTTLDAHYFDLCLLLHDAVRSLRLDKLSALDQAAAGFAWVMRQVQLRERPGDALPPDFVLRRGYGTSLERAEIFLAVLQELAIEGCMLAVPGKPGEPALRYWVPGALVNKDIYLFDTRLGLPLPGPKGQGIATFGQLRSQPEVLGQLAVDDKNPYDVSQDQANKAEIHVACMLSALAPRMRYLQDHLMGGDKVQLSVDTVALMQHFEAAAKAPEMKGVAVRVWNLPGDIGSPIRVLRNFVAEEEGGIDKSHRRDLAKQQLIPVEYFPVPFRSLIPEPQQRVMTIFAIGFIPFHSQAKMQKEFVKAWLPGLEEQQQPAGKNEVGVHKTNQLLERDRMPRDLHLRGRYDEATGELVIIRDELERQKKTVGQGLEDGMVNWCERVNAAFTALQAAKRALNPNPEELQRAQNAVDQLTKNAVLQVAFTRAAAAEPMSADVTYLLALCKHEQAERKRARLGKGDKGATEALRQAWESAASWWVTFLDNHGSHPGAAAARFHLARARQALGKLDEAASLLENMSDNPSPLERIARLYLARQWKARSG